MANGRKYVEPPRRLPRRYGLIPQSQLVEVDGGTDSAKVLNGIEWVPEQLGGAIRALGLGCEALPTAYTEDDMPDALASDPFYVFRNVTCSALGGNDPDTLKRARDALLYFEGRDVEAVFWTGLDDPDNTGNLTAGGALTDGNAVTPTGGAPVGGVSPRLAIGLLMDAMADSGGQMIHAPLVAMPYLMSEGIVVRNGSSIETADGSFEVVFGHGYPGTGPDGNAAASGTTWLYGTSMVRIYRGDLVTRQDFSRGRGAADGAGPQRYIGRAIREYVIQRDQTPNSVFAVNMKLA